MSEEEFQDLLDRPDWWAGPDGGAASMRTLREALASVVHYKQRAFLFRPGGFGAKAIWLFADEISRLCARAAQSRAA